MNLSPDELSDLTADPSPSVPAAPIHAAAPDARYVHRTAGCACHPRRSLVDLDTGRPIVVHRDPPPAPGRPVRPLTAKDRQLLAAAESGEW